MPEVCEAWLFHGIAGVGVACLLLCCAISGSSPSGHGCLFSLEVAGRDPFLTILSFKIRLGSAVAEFLCGEGEKVDGKGERERERRI